MRTVKAPRATADSRIWGALFLGIACGGLLAFFWNREAEGDPELKKILEKVAINKEVVVAVSNGALISPDGEYGMLKLWLDGMKHADVKNVLVIALDDQVATVLAKMGVATWRREPKWTKDATASNHGISALKFQFLREFLVLGYSVLLSDVDIVTLQNPFQHLVRDHDVEGLSDGFDNATAYMYNDVFDDPSMGWSRYAHSMRIWVINSGLFWLKPNPRTLALMDRITARLQREKAWDQAVFNEELWFPSHGDYKGSRITPRIMDYFDFVNSKVLFKTMRKDKARFGKHVPVMVHVNYHPDKFERMQAIWKRYVGGDVAALDKFPDGSCHNAPNC